jgi:quercetin dioxygenase-like cupin family protein
MTKTSSQEKLWFLDTLVTIRVSERDSDDGISVIEHQVPFGSSPPLHVHCNEDEVFHLLSGEARFSLAGEDIAAAAGDTLVAPKGVPHSFVVTSREGARWLTVTRNGDFETSSACCGRPHAPPRRTGCRRVFPRRRSRRRRWRWRAGPMASRWSGRRLRAR